MLLPAAPVVGVADVGLVGGGAAADPAALVIGAAVIGAEGGTDVPPAPGVMTERIGAADSPVPANGMLAGDASIELAEQPAATRIIAQRAILICS